MQVSCLFNRNCTKVVSSRELQIFANELHSVVCYFPEEFEYSAHVILGKIYCRI